MAKNLYKEQNEATPAIIIQESTAQAPEGFDLDNSVAAWCKWGLAYGDYLIQKLGIKTANIKFDPTLARGLGYYTGTIIEVKVDNFPSISGGGRYDDLTGKFGLKNVSGVGISFGADRIYDVLLDNNLYPEFKGDSTQVLFTRQSEEDETRFLPMLFQLRDKGINAELYTEQAKWQKQMIFAEKKEIKFIVSANKKGETFVKETDGTEKKPFSTVEELITIIKK